MADVFRRYVACFKLVKRAQESDTAGLQCIKQRATTREQAQGWLRYIERRYALSDTHSFVPVVQSSCVFVPTWYKPARRFDAFVMHEDVFDALNWVTL